MSKFKVGDRVRINRTCGNIEGLHTANWVGEEGVVDNVAKNAVGVYSHYRKDWFWVHDNDLELITSEQPVTTPSGGLNNYWLVTIDKPQRGGAPYQAEADDIIFALNLTFDEGEAFKAIWRSATARLGYGKPDNTPLYNAQKLVHRAKRILQRAEMNEGEDK